MSKQGQKREISELQKLENNAGSQQESEPMIGGFFEPQAPAPKEEGESAETTSKPAHKTISIHYPRPVFLSSILADVSEWSGFNFVLDPQLNRELQVFAPRKLPPDEAFQLFVASLETIGLRALQMDNAIVKIVPMLLANRAI